MCITLFTLSPGACVIDGKTVVEPRGVTYDSPFLSKNAMPLLAGTKLGLYEILAPIGQGGMGEVYQARDGKLGREGAIKVLAEREDTPVIDLRGIVHEVCLSQHLQNVTLIGYVAEHVTDADGSTSFYVEPADKPGIALLGRHTIYGPRDVVYEPLPMR